MSLSDLRHHYSPERSVDERLRLLEVAATHLPAPEFLWYPVAQEALASDELPLRRAAMRLLAFAPQSWDQVLVAALTTSDAELQRVALAALATQARAWPELVKAFGTLGDLPGWLPESREVWRQALAKLVPKGPQKGPEGSEPFWVPLPGEAEAPQPAELLSLKGQLAEAEAAHEQLQKRLESLQERLAGLDAAHHQAESARTTLESALEAERRGAKDIALRLERAIASHDTEIARYERELADHETVRKRLKLATAGSVAVAALVALVGAPVAWTMGAQQSAPAAVAMAAAPAAAEAALQDAEEAGYRRAVAGLAEHAGKLANEGHIYPSVAAWQAYARLAPTPTEAQLGVRQSEALLAKLKQAGAPAQEFREGGVPRVRTLSGAQAPQAVTPPRPAPRRQATSHAASASQASAARQRVVRTPSLKVSPPALPSPAAPAIPEDVRAKF